MAHVVYQLAQSLDGFVAEDDGGVGFLDLLDAPPDDDHGLAEFFAGVDALLMGRATYETALSLGPWPYEGKPTWVMTSKPPAEGPEGVRFSSGEPADVLAAIEAEAGPRVWLLGGGALASSFARAGLVDEWVVHVVPCVLGSGVRVVAGLDAPLALDLVDEERFPSGLVQLRYRTRRS